MTNGELDVSIRIAYKGGKALTMVEHHLASAITLLRADLTALKVPHPRTENIQFVYPGCLQLIWRTNSGSILHRNLVSKLKPKGSALLDFHVRLESLSIKYVTMREWAVSLHSRESSRIIASDTETDDVHEQPPPSKTPLHPREKTEPETHSGLERSAKFAEEAQRILEDSLRSFPELSNPHENPIFLNNSTQPPIGLNDNTAIHRLTRELWDTRRELTAFAAKELGIVESLRKLNAPGISNISNHATDLVTKTRMRMLETQLQDERRRRRQVEAALKDVERECKEPFVVPALLESFIMISKLGGEPLQ